MQKFIFYKIV